MSYEYSGSIWALNFELLFHTYIFYDNAVS